MRDPVRWHRGSGLDWMAVRLQHGRGLSSSELSYMFNIPVSTIRGHAREHGWETPMAEEDRRELARHVWLAGLMRNDPADAVSRESLKAMSEWRERGPEPDYRWKPKHDRKQKVSVNRIEEDDRDDGPADAGEVESLQRALGELIARFESGEPLEPAGPTAIGAGEAGAGLVPEETGDAGGDPAGDEAVATVGEAGAASA
jgi:hypothetical protein